MSTHTHTLMHQHMHTPLTLKVNITSCLVTWIPIVKFVSLAPATPSNLGDDRCVFTVTQFHQRELSLSVFLNGKTPLGVIH